MTDTKAAIAYIDTIKTAKHRNYAERLFTYYRDYGTPRQSAWPMAFAAQLPSSTERRIANAIRHYMVGDCTLKGILL